MEQTIFPQRLGIIEELCQLLSKEAEEDSYINQWFQGHKNRKEKGLSAYEPDDIVLAAGSNQPTCVRPKLLHQLRDYLLSHQWEKALEVLISVAKMPVGSSYPVWKCGLQLMQCQPEENNDSFIRSLYNQMKYVTDLNWQEVILDYLTFLLLRGQMEDAKEAMQENITHLGQKKETTDRDLYMSLLLKAYTGLVWYVEWKQCQHTIINLRNLAEQDTDSLTMSSQTSTVFLEMQMNNYAQKALTCFQALQGQAGVWDIFIQKYVELMVYNEKLDEAFQVLTEYRANNPDNPSAVRYLYSFCREHYPESEQTLALLKELVGKLPADQLVLEYCERIMKGNEDSALPYLFKLLDYPCWQREVKPWKMLAHCLEKLLGISDGNNSSDAVKVCWDVRKSWWPQFHFNKLQIEEEFSKFGVNFYKTAVAALLCGTGNEMVIAVQESLQQEEKTRGPMVL